MQRMRRDAPTAPENGGQQIWREMLRLQPAPPGRWIFALRSGICMAVPILLGWALGHPSAGMMASIGGFVSLYGAGRPYASRAILLAAVALAFSCAVMLGLAVASLPVLLLPVVVGIAVATTWVWAAWQVGGPGAYLVMLSCAAAASMPQTGLEVWQAGLLVLAGGSLSWALHVVGALWRRRAPERNATRAAAIAITGFLDAEGADGTRYAMLRHRAAHALFDSWQMLVGHQPLPAARNGELSRLRGINRALHQVFARASTAMEDPLDRSALRAEVEALRQGIDCQQTASVHPLGATLPLGRHAAKIRLIEALAPHSPVRRILLRVAMATTVAGLLASMLGLQRAYWAIGAAMLMLHQGLGWTHTLQRSVQRIAGTLLGLVLAGTIMWLHPRGPLLALVVGMVQATIEMLVVRNYALGVVFITAAGLTIASGGQPPADPAGFLWARALDTALGCVVALLVYRLLPPRADTGHLVDATRDVVRGADACVGLLVSGNVDTPTARRLRRDLQHAGLVLMQRYQADIDTGPATRVTAETAWPLVSSSQQLVYRMLAECWASERTGSGKPPSQPGSLSVQQGEQLHGALATIDAALQSGTPVTPSSPLPASFADTVNALIAVLPGNRSAAATPDWS